MRSTATTLTLLLASLLARGQDNAPNLERRRNNKVYVESAHQANRTRYAGNADMLVRKALVADRKAKRVVVLAEATGLEGSNVAEFFVIGEQSDHGYESVAISFASATDLIDALVFIGLERGRPVDFEKLQLWPKGERVVISVAARKDGKRGTFVRLETLMLDDRTKKPLEKTGFVFVGSRDLSSANPGVRRLAADEVGPRSIASNYNEPTTLLDVPRQAPQGDVYESQFMNPEHVFEPGALLEIAFEPEYKDGRRRVAEIAVKAVCWEAAPSDRIGGLRFEVSSVGGESLFGEKGNTTNCTLNALLAGMTKLVEDGRDPFVTVEIDKAVRLGGAAGLCALLSSIENEHGIRVDPPPEGQLYYRAFAPDERFRDRHKRIMQPWELHLPLKDGRPAARLTEIEQRWKDDSIDPELKIKSVHLPEPGDLRKELDRRGPGLPVILVFADPAVTYGQLMAYLAPVLDTHGVIHVYMERPSGTGGNEQSPQGSHP